MLVSVIFTPSVGIEDYPFIIRFKTTITKFSKYFIASIEDYPFIIRFKTNVEVLTELPSACIEDYPFIIRFKTLKQTAKSPTSSKVLRTIHL